MQNIRWIRVAMLCIPLFVVVAACSSDKDEAPEFVCEDPLGCVTIAPGEPLKLGSLQVLTGGAAPIGITQDNSIRLAIADHGGELLGHPLELISEDTGCTFEGGANAALRVAADPQMVAVLGTACSGAASGASPIVTEAGLTMISGANTAPTLTSIGTERGAEWHPGYFRAIYNGDQLTQAAAQFVYNELGLRQVVTVNDGDTFSRGLTHSFVTAFTALGGSVALDLTVNKGDENFQPALRTILNAEPQLVFMPIFQPEADLLVAQAYALPEFETMPFMAIESLLIDSFVIGLPPDIIFYFTTATVVDTPPLRELAERYQAAYGSYPHTTFRFAYDATGLLLHALEFAAQQEPDGTLHIGRQALRDAMYAVTEFEGMTGTFTCNEFGDCSNATFFIVRVEDPTAGLNAVLANVVASYEAAAP